ncbi:MAG: 2'-5' RNA ligase family protein [Planctomycetota bacterium]|jgi:2'-5' RNA ligase
MHRKAVDIVLLPPKVISDKAVEANRKLTQQFDNPIVLDNQNTLPHISLAMGCIEENDLTSIEKILANITQQHPIAPLQITGIQIATTSVGQKISAYLIGKTKNLQRLHETIMTELKPYFTYEVTADMLFSNEEIAQTTLNWIKTYPQNSSFKNFWPHITIGYGQITGTDFPITFRPKKLATCHLGNHCTCKKILNSIQLNK